MTYFLRHGAAKSGVHPRDDGYIPLRAMLNSLHFKMIKITESEVRSVVEHCPKNRFQLV